MFSELHSKAAQATVARFHRNLSNLRKKKEKGYKVGRLKRQSPSDYRSVTYNQSGFDLDEKRGRDRFSYVRFSKIGWVKIRYHRPILGGLIRNDRFGECSTYIDSFRVSIVRISSE
jgi:putative transposase